MLVRVAPDLRSPVPRLMTKPFRQTGPTLRTRRSVRTQVDLVPPAQPDAVRALDSVRPAGKLVPRITTRVPMELPARLRAGRASLVDSTASTARKAARSDQ